MAMTYPRVWENPGLHEGTQQVPRALCSPSTLAAPEDDVLRSNVFALHQLVDDQGEPIPLTSEDALNDLDLHGRGKQIAKGEPRLFNESALPDSACLLIKQDLDVLGTPLFQLSISEMSDTAPTVEAGLASSASVLGLAQKDAVQIVVRSFHHDLLSRDSEFARGRPGAAEVAAETTLLVRAVRLVVVLPRPAFLAVPLFAKSFASAKALQVDVPRFTAASALVTILENLMRSFVGGTRSVPGAQQVFTSEDETDDLIEAYTLAHQLGLAGLVQQNRSLIETSITAASFVPVAYVSARFGDRALISACHRWLLANLIDTGRLIAAAGQSDGIILDVPNRGTMKLVDNVIYLRRFHIAIDTFKVLLKETPAPDPTTLPPPSRVVCTLLREGTDLEATYTLVERATNMPLLACRYDSVVHEYVISRDPTHIVRHSPSYVGGIRCNLPGTVFSVFDAGARYQNNGLAPLRREFGVISYDLNFWGLEPRAFQIFLPLDATVAAPGVLLENLLAAGQFASFLGVRNKPPKWNEERSTYTLDFRNNVRKASKKNFILETDTATPEEVMMMGKLERNRFYLHFNSPMFAVVAFAVAVSSFHRKLMVK